MSKLTRRSVLGALTAATAVSAQGQRQRPRPWKPKLGVLARFTESNIEWVRQQGFTSIELGSAGILNPETVTDAQIEQVKATVKRAGLYASVVGAQQNHIAPDLAQRARNNERFIKALEMTGKLGIPYVGTGSGNMPGRPLKEQVAEIVKVYNEKYFPVCQKYNVRILWEPWVGGPNIATGPVGYEALFSAFGDSPYVGIQFDPSHLQWQMIDPVQAAKDFVGKIYDMHLKDLEILWPVVRKTGIQPLNNARWWRFRLPGFGMVDWHGLFSVLMEAGYTGALNIEHEDEFYYPPYDSDGNFTEQFKAGFQVAHEFLKQLVPA